MKRILSIIFCCLFFLATLTGCQPTPEKTVVVNKGDNSLMEKIQTSTAQSSFTAPKEWKESFVGEGSDNFFIEIDAEVIVPEVEAFPVVKVEPAAFTAEYVWELGQTFFPGLTPVVADLDYPMTKSEIEAEIILNRSYFTNPDSNLNAMDMPEEERNEYIATVNKRIEELEALYPNAPELPGYLIHNAEELNEYLENDTGYDILFLDENNLTKGSIRVGPLYQAKKRINSLFINFYENTFDDIHRPEKSEEELLQYANEAFEKLGVGDTFALNSASYLQGAAYEANYTRTYHGCPVTCENSGAIGQSELYTAPWSPESISIATNDKGVTSISWDSPSSTVETLNENVELLPFEEIQEIYKKNSSLQLSWISDFEEELISKTVNLKEARLGLMRVSIKDRIDEYMMIPVWDFFGTITYTYSSQPEMGYVLDENMQFEEKYYFENRQSFMTINAIDGSIIDRSLGY